MAHSIKVRYQVLGLRKNGYSVKELAHKFNIAQSTISLWVREVCISPSGKKRIIAIIGRSRNLAAENKRKKTTQHIKTIKDETETILAKIHIDAKISLLLCAMIHYCEGNKGMYSELRFTNSDPDLISTFLRLLRQSFDINERKFRICLHLHAYHNVSQQIKFWSRITRIPTNQFLKPFQKSNTGKRSKLGYNGCVSIRYYSTDMSRRLQLTALGFMKFFGGIGSIGKPRDSKSRFLGSNPSTPALSQIRKGRS